MHSLVCWVNTPISKDSFIDDNMKLIMRALKSLIEKYRSYWSAISHYVIAMQVYGERG